MILRRYILRELMLTFLLSFTAIVSVCAIGIIFQLFRSYEGMTLGFILGIAPMAFAEMAPWAMVVSACLASTLVYGRLSADNEITAIRASGVHPHRMISPAIRFGLILGVLAFLIHAELAPRARHHRRVALKDTVLFGLQHPPSGKQNAMKIGNKNRLSYADAQDGVLKYPVLLKLDDQGNPVTKVIAREGRIEMPENGLPALVMTGGSSTQIDPKKMKERPDAAVTVEARLHSKPRVEFDLEEDLYRRSKDAPDMSFLELVGAIAKGTVERQEALTEFHGRFSKAVAPLALVLVCAPIGIYVKKGSRLAGIGVALPPMLGYILLMLWGQALGSKGTLAPAIAAYGSTLAPFAVAAALLFKIYRR